MIKFVITYHHNDVDILKIISIDDKQTRSKQLQELQEMVSYLKDFTIKGIMYKPYDFIGDRSFIVEGDKVIICLENSGGEAVRGRVYDKTDFDCKSVDATPLTFKDLVGKTFATHSDYIAFLGTLRPTAEQEDKIVAEKKIKMAREIARWKEEEKQKTFEKYVVAFKNKNFQQAADIANNAKQYPGISLAQLMEYENADRATTTTTSTQTDNEMEYENMHAAAPSSWTDGANLPDEEQLLSSLSLDEPSTPMENN